MPFHPFTVVANIENWESSAYIQDVAATNKEPFKTNGKSLRTAVGCS